MLPAADDRREGCRAVVGCQAGFFSVQKFPCFLSGKHLRGSRWSVLKWKQSFHISTSSVLFAFISVQLQASHYYKSVWTHCEKKKKKKEIKSKVSSENVSDYRLITRCQSTVLNDLFLFAARFVLSAVR